MISSPKTSQQILADLIAFDTTSRESNLALIAYIENYLTEYGISSYRNLSPEGNKANLYATIGPVNTSGIMLSGHTDVVPVDGQTWDTNPFKLTQKGNKLYGRGSADMKGFIACVLALAPSLINMPLKRPVHLAFSYDEEIGCVGVQHLIEWMRDHTVLPMMAIIGEPTSMGIVNGHKGKRGYTVKIHGKPSHSAYTHDGVNAITAAAELIVYLNEIMADIAQTGPFDKDYRVPHTTIQVGTIKGGVALNIVPEYCEFRFEIRHLPEHDPKPIINHIQHKTDQIISVMRQQHAAANIEIIEDSNYPGMLTAADEAIINLLRSLLAFDQPLTKVSFGTEGGLFQERLNIPSAVCGPGDIAQAHKPNEFVSVDQLADCDRFLQRLGQWLLNE